MYFPFHQGYKTEPVSCRNPQNLNQDSNKLYFENQGSGLLLENRSCNRAIRRLCSEVVAKSLDKDNGIEPSLYITDEFEYSDKLTFSGGLRFTMFMTLGPRTNFLYTEGLSRSAENIYDTVSLSSGKIDQDWSRLEYRFSSRYIINPYLSVKGGIQRNYQYLNIISNTTLMAPTDTWKLSNSYIKPQRGDQIALGVYRNFSHNNLELSTEVYYKILRNIIDYKGGAELLMNEHLETDILNARGKAYGMEIMLKKQSGNVTGWISYAYARSFLKIESEFEEEKINGYQISIIGRPVFMLICNFRIRDNASTDF
jgi:outer membrane receptor protein involved in Fe transport